MSTTQIRWIIKPWATALARCEAGETGDLAAPVAEALAGLEQWIAGSGLDRVALLGHLVPLAVRFDREGDLASGALTKLLGSSRAGSLTTGLTLVLGALGRAVMTLEPESSDCLEADTTALRDAWDSMGDRLLEAVGRLTDPAWLVETADVLLLPPRPAGWGRAYPACNLVSIGPATASETAPPDALHLAWLLTQLNADLPMFQGNLSPPTAARTAGLACVPVVLQAGAESELVQHDGAARDRALAAWNLAPPETAAALAGRLGQWWEVYRQSRPSWPAALAALSAMLGAPSEP